MLQCKRKRHKEVSDISTSEGLFLHYLYAEEHQLWKVSHARLGHMGSNPSSNISCEHNHHRCTHFRIDVLAIGECSVLTSEVKEHLSVHLENI
jgi:hypothetical protein